MIECGLLSGDPLAYQRWTREQRVAAEAWSLARRRGAVSAWAFTAEDLTRWLSSTLEQLAGLRRLVYEGVVVTFRGK